MRRLLASFVLICLAAAVAGCALPYYMQAARGQVGLMRQRVPIDELVADSSVDAVTRERLELVETLRAFAVAELALPDNDSYSSYVDLGRNYVVVNVVAAGEFSTAPVTWCFPVAGCVAYRGYFDPARAESFADRLAAQGYDVFSGGSPAYSTLGFFDDPVLSTMISRSEDDIAGMLFHELAHQRVYVKGDTELNESFATAVEQYGVEIWLARRGLEVELDRYRASLDRQRDFAALIARHRARLESLYESDLGARDMRAAKLEAFAALRRDYALLRAGWGSHGDYDGWFSGELNNATLVAITSYQRWVPVLRARLDALGPEDFYSEFERIVGLEPAERSRALDVWEASSATARVTDLGELVETARDVGMHDGLHASGPDTEGRESVVTADARDGQ